MVGVCQFGLAHVDTPKGDLDMDGVVTSPPNIVADNSFVYPYGTTEQFPLMEDSDLNVLTDSAHYYMECSNKGTCDRSSGECTCYDGYDGAACQRASCPGYPSSCSGHGVCKTIEQLAALDYGNQYALWDRKSLWVAIAMPDTMVLIAPLKDVNTVSILSILTTPLP